jgi:hypothetical protein
MSIIGVEKIYIIGNLPAWKDRTDEFEKSSFVGTLKQYFGNHCKIYRANKADILDVTSLDVLFTLNNGNLTIEFRQSPPQMSTVFAQGSSNDTWGFTGSSFSGYTMVQVQNTNQTLFHSVPVSMIGFQPAPMNKFKKK